MDSNTEIFPEVILSDYDEVMLSDEERTAADTSTRTVEPPRNLPLPSDNRTENSVATTAPSAIPSAVETPTSMSASTGMTPSVSNNRATHQLRPCRLCPRVHNLFRCSVFKNMSIEKRMRMVVANLYCVNCLRIDHKTNKCPSNQRCNRCGERHHSMLHSRTRSIVKTPAKRQQFRSQSASSPQVLTTTSNPSASSSTLAHLPIGRVISLAPTLVVRLCTNNSSIPVRAILDPCCRISQICESLVQHLRWPVSTIGDSYYCDFWISSSFDESQRLCVTAKVAKLNCGVTPPVSVPSSIRDSFAGLELADPNFYRSAAVAIVLGPEIYSRVIAPRVISQPGLPMAQYTLFGWVISGPAPF